MAKQGGLGARFYFGGVNLSGDIQSFKTSGGPAAMDVTDITQSAHSRIGGLRDGSIGVTSYWDPALAHPSFSALPAADVIGTLAIGTSIGSAAACIVGKQLNYDGTRAADGMMTFAVDEPADGFALEWGQLLTAGARQDSAATNGTALDTGGSLAFGAQAYLQMLGFVGTDATVKIQDSADNSTFADVSGLAFTQITSPTVQAQRISITNTSTVREYVRAVSVTTGGFSSLTFVVVLVKNPVTGVVF